MISNHEILRFASIDIGSNAVRLLLSNVVIGDHQPVFRKVQLIRMPIRLGEEAFIHKYISKEKTEKLENTLLAFKLLSESFEAIDIKACATSALREAKNGTEIVEELFRKSQIPVEIISGRMEAKIIHTYGNLDTKDQNSAYLFADVGGGSTELTIFYNGKVLNSKSFNIGTLRLLNHMITKTSWLNFREWIYENTKNFKTVITVGSGGNINKLCKFVVRKDKGEITYKKLKEAYQFIKSFSLDDRISLMQLNPDRADVIVPASRIYLTIMKSSNSVVMQVPQFGLVDGLVRLQYNEFENKIQSKKWFR